MPRPRNVPCRRANFGWMLRDAMEAADYLLRDVERAIDRVVGEPVRRALSRYASAFILAVPIAWIGGGMHWNATSGYGLLGGMLLFAVLDAVRQRMRARPKGR